MSNSVIYDGFDISSLVHVEAVRRPVMASRYVESKDIPGAHGSRFKAVKTESKTIEVDISIFALLSGQRRRNERFEEIRRNLVGRLAKDHPCELVLYDAPDLSEMAVLDGSTDLERLTHVGSTTLVFKCCDPRSYGNVKTLESEGGTLHCDVEGTAETEPQVVVYGQAPLVVTFDDADFIVLGDTDEDSTLMIDADNHDTSSNGEYVRIDIMSDYPEWKPGRHTVTCSMPFTVRWVERWL